MTDPESLPYRPCAGFMLVNAASLVFVGQRIDASAHGYWQMPQGGIDPGEDLREAALRELHEEIGVGPDKVEVIAGPSRALRYDLPPELIGKVWKGRYRGQEQYWFLGRFLGEDSDIDLEAHNPPEFNAWRWVEPGLLPELIIPFKRATYEDVLKEFREFI
ncbi:RNA pyrophosphohydrolase [Erythrobacter sp. WG]|uniref:RNA pyrophosphohydrolase n=1 Tax=Erythrobacter sp. WG TaxID=2985510 RepID=UPI002271901C|nr:RNA pyrophosphohydrolase [Erythrobacter sp. WG]MCX9148708.1 RNA pyrophosphohydrolase [Erythrobacter sp. WG]